MTIPKVTIIMPTYNREELVLEAATSIIKQDYDNWECIIIDDNSTDRSVEKLAELVGDDERFIVIVKDKSIPKGAQQSRNLGLQRATGRYIQFLDSDDLLSSSCLSRRVAFMEQLSHVSVGIFPGLRFKKKPFDILTIISTYRGNDPIRAFLEFNTPWTILNGIWRRDELVRCGISFDEKVMGFQDIDFHLQALFKGLTYEMAESEPDCFWREQQYDNIGKHLADEVFVSSHAYLINKINESVEQLEGGKEAYDESVRKFIFFILRMQLARRKFSSFDHLLNKVIEDGMLTGCPVVMVRFLAYLCRISQESFTLSNKFIFMLYKLFLLGKLPFCHPNKHFLTHKYKRDAHSPAALRNSALK